MTDAASTNTAAAAAGTVSIAGRELPRMGYGTMRLTGPRIFGPPADRDKPSASFGQRSNSGSG